MVDKISIHSHTMQPKEKRLNTEGLLIPDDFTMDILSRLPVKSLIRFKLVSKSFNSLISDPYFVKLHLRRSSAPNANPNIILQVPLRNVKKSIEFFHVKSFLKTQNKLQPLCATCGPHLLLGSCNGLICVTGIDIGYFNSREQPFWVILWNPATQSVSRQCYTFEIGREVIDSFLSNDCGFGYDHVSDTYKVMSVVNGNVFVFNMSDHNCRLVGYYPDDVITLEVVGVHFNGTLNWLASPDSNEDNIIECNEDNIIEWDSSSCMILSFDLNKEEYVWLLLPAIPYKFSDPHLGVLGECLCVSVQDKQSNFVIWQLKEFGVDESWTKLLNINYDKELKPRSLPPPRSFPLYMFDNGVFVLMLPEMFLYNNRDKTVDPLHLGGVPISASCAVICCESLISPPRVLGAVETRTREGDSKKAQVYGALSKAYQKLVKDNAEIKKLKQALNLLMEGGIGGCSC